MSTPFSRTRQRNLKRQTIISEASRLFNYQGTKATTLDDIALHLGVRKTALYHYFPDKESILYECHRRSLAELERLIEEARALDSAADRLSFLIREHVRVMTDTLDGSPLAFEVTALSEEHQREVISARDRYERELRRTIDHGVRGGEFSAVNSKVAVFAILGAINWIARWYRPEGTLHAEEIGDGFADQLVGGLRCR